MQNFSIEIEKVNNIVNNFVEKLYGHYPVGRDKLYQFTMAILCKAKGECRFLLNIIEEFKIYNIDFELIENIIEDIREICKSNIGTILPICADSLLQKYVRSTWGESMQPREITDLVLELMNERGCKTVYNPFAGLASYSMGKFIEKYYAQELSFVTSNLARMRMELNDIDYSEYDNLNSYTHWDEHNADCIVSTPPFGLKIEAEIAKNTHASTAEEYLLSQFINGSAKYGFFVVSRGVCFKSHGTALDLRKDICDMHMLEMVINLPSGIFTSTGVSTTLLVLNRFGQSDKVFFVDAELILKDKPITPSEFAHVISDDSLPCVYTVSYNDIYTNDCSFDVARYATQHIDLAEGERIVSLGEILIPDNGIRCDFNGEYVTNVVESNNYASSFPKLGDDVDNQVYVDKTKYRFHGPHFLLNMQGKIYIHKGDTDFYVGSALRKLVFKVDSSVINIEYLALHLMLNDVLQRSFFGAGMARINPSSLLNYKIPISDLDQQTQEVARLKRHYLKDERKRLGIREAGGDLSHMLGMPKDKIDLLIENLLSSDSLSQKDKERVKAIDDNFRYMLRVINTVGADFSSIEGNPHNFSIGKMLSDYVDSLKNMKFSNTYGIVSEVSISDDAEIFCDEDLLRVLLDTAFLNAYKHGFKKRKTAGNLVKLDCHAVEFEGKNYACISVSNNGAPSEISLTDFVKNGFVAGTTGNTGKGGYHIYCIAKQFGGFVYLTSSKEWPFILEVLLPVTSLSRTEKIEVYGNKCI